MRPGRASRFSLASDYLASYQDPDIQRDLHLYPFKVNSVVYVLRPEADDLWQVVEKEGRPYFDVVLQGQRMLYSPEQISSIILKRLKGLAEQHFGRKVKDVVLAVPGAWFFPLRPLHDVSFGLVSASAVFNRLLTAVPVEFDEVQRERTRWAAKDTGLNPLDMVRANECRVSSALREILDLRAYSSRHGLQTAQG